MTQANFPLIWLMPILRRVQDERAGLKPAPTCTDMFLDLQAAGRSKPLKTARPELRPEVASLDEIGPVEGSWSTLSTDQRHDFFHGLDGFLNVFLGVDGGGVVFLGAL